MKKPYTILTINENRIREITKVLSNATATRIIDYLSTVKSSTESEISVSLNLPLSTVHYNLENLKKSKLIESKEFHYSEKGKEVNHYKLANRFIIIAPTKEGIKSKLLKALPSLLVVLIGAFMIKSVHVGISKDMFAQRLLSESAAILPLQPTPSIYLWFLFGGLLSIIVMFFAEYIFSKFFKKI